MSKAPVTPPIFIAKIDIPSVEKGVLSLKKLKGADLKVEVTLEQPDTAAAQRVGLVLLGDDTAPQNLVKGKKTDYFISHSGLKQHLHKHVNVGIFPGPTNPNANGFTIEE